MARHLAVQVHNAQVGIRRILRLQVFQVLHAQAVSRVLDRRTAGNVAQQLGGTLHQSLLVRRCQQCLGLQTGLGQRQHGLLVFCR